MTKHISEEQRELIERLGERGFEYKIVTVPVSVIGETIKKKGQSLRPKGWVYVGHFRAEEQETTVGKVFYARLLPSDAEPKKSRQFEFQTVVTMGLPGRTVLLRYEGWETLLTKHWSALETEENKNVCVTFLVRQRVRGAQKTVQVRNTVQL